MKCAAASVLSFPAWEVQPRSPAQGEGAEHPRAPWGAFAVPPGWAPLLCCVWGQEWNLCWGSSGGFTHGYSLSVTWQEQSVLWMLLGSNHILLAPLPIKASQWRRIITSWVFASYYYSHMPYFCSLNLDVNWTVFSCYVSTGLKLLVF